LDEVYASRSKKVSLIDFKVNMTTARIDIFIFSKNVKFYPRTLSKVLGFTKGNYIASCSSNNCVSISNITSINLICDLIEGTYQDGKRNNCLYNFPYGSVLHGYRIVSFVNSPIYLPVNRKTINSIRFKIVDQENNLLDFNGENISFALHLKQV